MDVNSDEYIDKVIERFEEVVLKTQVVDTVLTRSHFMRNKNARAQAMSAFMSEPTKNYNMLRNALASGDIKKIGRSTGTFVASALAVSAASSLIDAMRWLDDDDENDKKFGERYLKAFGENVADNANPMNTIPGVKDVIGILNGWEPKRMEYEATINLINSVKEIIKFCQGDSKKSVNDIINKCAIVVSQFTGIPIANTRRDVVALFQFLKYDIIGEDTYNQIIKKAANARKSGDMNTYKDIVYHLKDEGKSQDDIIKDINKMIRKLDKEDEKKSSGKKENSTPKSDKKDESTSIYAASDLKGVVSKGDMVTTQKIINDWYESELSGADTSIKGYKNEVYKKVRSRVRSSITAAYKAIEDTKSRKAVALKLTKLRIAGQQLYKVDDFVRYEKELK